MKIISNETVSRDGGAKSKQTRVLDGSSVKMMYIPSNTVSTKNCRDAPF